MALIPLPVLAESTLTDGTQNLVDPPVLPPVSLANCAIDCDPEPQIADLAQHPEDYCRSLLQGHQPPAYCRALQQQSERRLRSRTLALDAIDQGILVIDCQLPEYPIVYVNRGFQRLTGYAAEEILGQRGLILDRLVVDPTASAELRQAIHEQRRCAVEILTHRRNGSTYWNEVTLTPVHDTNGRLTHYVSVTADVTRRHLLEEQLRRSQKMDAIGQLASGVAHEFNNILTLILGYADNLLHYAELDGESREAVTEIHTAAQRAAKLTRQLLVFSRNEALAAQSINLSSMVRNLHNMLHKLLGEHIVFHTKLESGVWPVTGDQTHLEQAVMNLAINARDAMPNGGTLEIQVFNANLRAGDARLLPEMQPGCYVGLSVRDSGEGIEAATLARIFEPFYTTKEPGKGTGLGLPFVYGIVKQCQGHLTVESAPGCGSTFTIYLPTNVESSDWCDSQPCLEDEQPGSETILLVEDEQGIREFLARTLQSAGYQVHTASNGREALVAVERLQTPLDLVITDIVMPQMNGCSLLAELRKSHPHLPAIFMSGYADDALAGHGITSEEVPILTKPFLPAELLARVRDMIDGKLPSAMAAFRQ